jgi:ABC-type nitrate/sulfonate/bicarbonate transport system substrate-binding protein
MMWSTLGTVRLAVGFLGVLAALLGEPSVLHAQMPQSISVIVFPGGFNWPIWVAQQKGYFSQTGIEVKLTNTPNSVFQLTGLIEGRFDIAITAIDNVVAYMEGQGEAKLDRQPDIFAFMGGDNGFLSLVTVPEVKTYADLKGRTLSVDALTTGYAFVLLDLLERGGLKRGDFELVKAGGVLVIAIPLERGREREWADDAGCAVYTGWSQAAACPHGGFLLIWPAARGLHIAVGLDVPGSRPLDRLRAQRPCLENPNMVTLGLRLARA